MKAIITGMNGTLAPFIAEVFKNHGYEIIIWDREKVSITNQSDINEFISSHNPSLFLHIATGPVEWIDNIINALKPLSIPLLFTSTESVFDTNQDGPFSTDDIPKSTSDYGKYKIECEQLINKKYKEFSYITRLGWQIGLEPKKNNMLTYLVNEGKVKASDKWIPSTSFMPDTASALLNLVTDCKPGLYHIDGNEDNWSFYKLAKELVEVFDIPVEIVKDDSFVRNNRLLNNPILVKSLQSRINSMK